MGSLRESLLLTILCFAKWNEVISSHISSQASFEEPVLPENQISIKMPGTSPQEVCSVNQWDTFVTWRVFDWVVHCIGWSNFIMHDRCCRRIAPSIRIDPLNTKLSFRSTRSRLCCCPTNLRLISLSYHARKCAKVENWKTALFNVIVTLNIEICVCQLYATSLVMNLRSAQLLVFFFT